jgi:hypothetical protein
MPAITSFDSQFAVSWSVAGADYVQFQYPCVEQVFVIGDAGSQMLCGVRPRRNFPAHGAATLLLMNYNSAGVRLPLTLKPFSDGIEYHSASKTITVDIAAKP